MSWFEDALAMLGGELVLSENVFERNRNEADSRCIRSE